MGCPTSDAGGALELQLEAITDAQRAIHDDFTRQYTAKGRSGKLLRPMPDYQRRSWIVSYRRSSSNFDQVTPFAKLRPFACACARWWDVVLPVSGFWADIGCRGTSNDVVLEVQRSQNRTLEVEGDTRRQPSVCGHTRSRATNDLRLAQLASIFRPHAHRWRALNYTFETNQLDGCQVLRIPMPSRISLAPNLRG